MNKPILYGTFIDLLNRVEIDSISSDPIFNYLKRQARIIAVLNTCLLDLPKQIESLQRLKKEQSEGYYRLRAFICNELLTKTKIKCQQ